jgi:ubiquinone/menaquinone biosynthesis C-methylase UbiE
MAAAVTEEREGFVAALRFRSLNRAFDPVVRLTMREARFKPKLLDQAAIRPGHRVLDLGCGTGTLAIMAKERIPEADVVGLDGDPDILKQAGAKAKRTGQSVRFDQGFSTDLPYEDDSLDRVLSTLFFHHLTTDEKRQTAREIVRVLKPGGELHVADFTRPRDPLMAGAFFMVRAFDGFERTRVNGRGQLGDLLIEEGFDSYGETQAFRTGFGLLALGKALSG